jgi:hypothetical protein
MHPAGYRRRHVRGLLLLPALATMVLAALAISAPAMARPHAHMSTLSYNEAGFVGGQFANQWIAPNFYCTHAPDSCATGHYSVYRNPARCGTNCVDVDVQNVGWYWTFALRVRVQGPPGLAGVTSTWNWWVGRWH